MAAVEAQATTLVALSGDKTLVPINAEFRRVLNRIHVKVNGGLSVSTYGRRIASFTASSRMDRWSSSTHAMAASRRRASCR
jgi:hypothetical protein